MIYGPDYFFFATTAIGGLAVLCFGGDWIDFILVPLIFGTFIGEKLDSFVESREARLAATYCLSDADGVRG